MCLLYVQFSLTSSVGYYIFLMDHFLLPAHPTIQKITLPYASTEPYDSRPFTSYGERNGKEWLTILGDLLDRPDIRIRESSEPTPTQEREPLFLRHGYFLAFYKRCWGSEPPTRFCH